MHLVFWVLIIAASLVLIYFGIGSYAAVTMTKIGEHPQYNTTPGDFGLIFEAVQFPSRVDCKRISAWYIPCPGADRAIILVHGRDASKQNAISGRISQLAADLNRIGIAVLMIDLRGHGESEGTRYTFGFHERRDVLGAVDFLLGHGFSPGKIGALGISLGGAAVIYAAVEEPAIGAVIVESTFADINLLIKPNWRPESGLPMFFLPGVFMMWQLLIGFDLKKVKPAMLLAHIAPRPILILHSNSDEVVDSSHARTLKAALPSGVLTLFEGCSHAELYRDCPDEYLNVLTQFLKATWSDSVNGER